MANNNLFNFPSILDGCKVLRRSSNNTYTIEAPDGTKFYEVESSNPGLKFYVEQDVSIMFGKCNPPKAVIVAPKIGIRYPLTPDTLSSFFQNYGLYRYDFYGAIKNIFRYLKVIKHNPPDEWLDITNNVIAKEEWSPFDDENTILYIGNLYQYNSIQIGLAMLGTESSTSFKYWDSETETWNLSDDASFDWTGIGTVYLTDCYELNCKKVLNADFTTPYYWIQATGGATDAIVNDLYWTEERDVLYMDGIPSKKKLFYLGNDGFVNESSELDFKLIPKIIDKGFKLNQRVVTDYPTLGENESIKFYTRSRTVESDYYYITEDTVSGKIALAHINGNTGTKTELKDFYTDFGSGDFSGLNGMCEAGGYIYITYTRSTGGSLTNYETIKRFDECDPLLTELDYRLAGHEEIFYDNAYRWTFEGSEKNLESPDWDFEHNEYIEPYQEVQVPPQCSYGPGIGMHSHRCIPELTVWLKRYNDTEDRWWPFWYVSMIWESTGDVEEYSPGFTFCGCMHDPKQHYLAMRVEIRNEYGYDRPDGRPAVFKMDDDDEIRILHTESWTAPTPSYWIARYNIAEDILDMNSSMVDQYSYLKSNYAGDRVWMYSSEFDCFEVFDNNLVPKGTYSYAGQNEADFSDYTFDKNENMWIGYTESSCYGGDTYYIIGFYGIGHDNEGEEIRRWEVPEVVSKLCVY